MKFLRNNDSHSNLFEESDDETSVVRDIVLTEEMLQNIFQFMDAVALIQKKPVYKDWQRLCVVAIDYM